ncbi:MAG: outer membrane protein assembly factor BamA [Pseudomonadota bacterium]
MRARIWTPNRIALRFAGAACVAAAVLCGGQALPGVGPTAAVAQTVRSIQVDGNRRVEPETVRSYLTFTVGDPYDPARVNESLRALFGTGLFADVRIDRRGSTIVVTVQENPVVSTVAFEGNSAIDDKTLIGEVRLKSRSVYTRARALADARRIADVYRRQGRFAAAVDPKIIQLDQNRVNVVFEINEGEKTTVQAINFIGNRAFSDSQLRDIITTTQSGWFDFLKGTNVYDPDRLNLDKELLRQYYLKNGYADAQVVSASAELDREGSGFFITFVVDEGELYKFGDVRIENTLQEFNPNTLQGEILTLSGAEFNASQINKTVEKMTLRVAEQGFAFARVRAQSYRNPEARVIDLTYTVSEGPRTYIERIDISGNDRTKDHVIRREFRLAEGDAFNPLLVDRAKKRLVALGFFKKVEVRPRPGSSRDRVIIDVAVQEQSTGELGFGAGYSTQEGVIGDITLKERNLFGNGQFVRLKLAGSLSRFQIDLSFTEPRFLDRNLSAGFDIFHKEVDASDESGYESRKTGGAIRLGFPLAENYWMSTSYRLTYDDIFDVEDDASLAIKQAAGCDNISATTCGNTDGTYFTSAISTSVRYDTRNHPRNPNKGIYVSVGTDFAGVGGDAQYVRFSGEARAYYPLFERVTLVGRVVGGHILGWGGDEPRLLDLYYRGGETIRGFERSGIGPRDPTTNDALGGTSFYAATAEVRFPIPLLPTELGISGAVFADAGSVFGATDDAKSIVPDLEDDASIRASVGVSILWSSPLGPLRFDYAFPLAKEDYDEVQEFRFGAATQF